MDGQFDREILMDSILGHLYLLYYWKLLKGKILLAYCQVRRYSLYQKTVLYDTYMRIMTSHCCVAIVFV